MLNENLGNRCGVLYIDDEEKALKYFKMAFSDKFNIFTAPSGKEGIDILRREAGGIGIVISDQRMPEMLGAEILGIVRQEQPNIVRILTTAYSDLDSAIQAVNRGHIYQYVVKPWDLAELGMVLQRAADYFHVLSERNELLALKMSTLQRIVCSDRVKWLLLTARNLGETGRAKLCGGLVSLIDAMPPSINWPATRAVKNAAGDFDAGALIRNEYLAGIEILGLLAEDQAHESASASCRWLDESAYSGLRDLDKGMGLIAHLDAFLSAMHDAHEIEIGRVEVSRSEGAEPPVLRIGFKPDPEAGGSRGILQALFALLVSRERLRASVELLKMLVAFRSAGFGCIRIQTGEEGGNENDLPFTLEGPPMAAPEDVLQSLTDRFSSWDISRL